MRALWTNQSIGEAGAPPQRIIHALFVNLPSGSRLNRIGIKQGTGYAHCGSGTGRDNVAQLRILALQGAAWHEVRAAAPVPSTTGADIHWESVDVASEGFILEIRRSLIDGWWPSYNLAQTAFLLEGESVPQVFALGTSASLSPLPRPTRPQQGRGELLQHARMTSPSEPSLPAGVTALNLPGEIRFKSRFLEIGFRLGSPGLSFLGMDGEGQGDTSLNLLCRRAGWQKNAMRHGSQGPQLELWGQGAIGAVEEARPLTYARVRGASVKYDVQLGPCRYAYHWELAEKTARLTLERSSEVALRAARGSAWQFAFDCGAAATATLGTLHRNGETGVLDLPLLLHAPGRGTLLLQSEPHRGSNLGQSDPPPLWRSDAIRPLLLTTGELKVGEIPQPEGDYLLPSGTYQACVSFSIVASGPDLEQAPPVVRRAVARCALSGLAFRADTATLANNAVSIHVPLCADHWSALALRLGKLPGGLDAADWLRQSLARHWDGAPGYGSGNAPDGGRTMSSEYLATGVNTLLATAEYLLSPGSESFALAYSPQILVALNELFRLDTDGDGLIESHFRTGITGTAQWSTNWWDAISFGYKDAFSNALLYRLLELLPLALRRHGLTAPLDLIAWRYRLRSSFHREFWNPATGWYAGWRCSESELHDYGFLFVNGAAAWTGLVTGGRASRVITSMFQQLSERLGGDFRLGLPGNLLPIPPRDCASPQQGKSYGCFENGGLTHSQASHFVRGLAAAGMVAEADDMLGQLMDGLANGTAFGGCGSDLEWRRPDGVPCGYEGILTDQFTLLALALDRYRHGTYNPRTGPPPHPG